MSQLPMINMDETLDNKPTLRIEGKQLALLNITGAEVGKKIMITSPATIIAIHDDKGDPDNGIDPYTYIELELTQLIAKEPESNPASLFPNSPAPGCC